MSFILLSPSSYGSYNDEDRAPYLLLLGCRLLENSGTGKGRGREREMPDNILLSLWRQPCLDFFQLHELVLFFS